MLEWIRDNPVLLSWLTGVGVVLFVGSLFLAPAIIVRIPADYFAHRLRPPGALDGYHIALRIAVRIAKSVLGVVLILAGLAMLVLPGQGLLTVLIGILLIEFPGKYRLEQAMIRRRRVLHALNWLRARRGREPLRVRGSREGRKAAEGQSRAASAA